MEPTEYHLDQNGHPLPGSRWRHHSGVVYVVLMMVNVEPERQDKFPTSVVYQSGATGKRYSRPVAEWLEKFEAVA